jgi:hypothetical protein
MHITIEQHNEDIASYKAEIAELEEYIEKLITAGTDCAVTTEVHQCSRSWFNLTNNEPLDELSFLDDIPESADNYEIEMYDGQDDGGCEGGACKI